MIRRKISVTGVIPETVDAFSPEAVVKESSGSSLFSDRSVSAGDRCVIYCVINCIFYYYYLNVHTYILSVVDQASIYFQKNKRNAF